MMIDLLGNSLEQSAYIVLAFLVAGGIKGILGMGLPAILMVLLTFIMPPIEAITLITLPMLFVNVVQFARGPAPLQAVQGHWVFAVVMAVVIAITAYNLKAYPQEILLASIGVAMAMFAIPSLLGWQFSLGPERIWQVVAGGLGGILGGLSSIWSPPVVIYLLARRVDKDDFVGITGFLFMVGSGALAITLGAIDLLNIDVIIPSAIGLGFALMGFRIGELIRRHINRDAFRKIVLGAFLIFGIRLMLLGMAVL